MNESTPRCICGSFHPYPLTINDVNFAEEVGRRLIVILAPAVRQMAEQMLGFTRSIGVATDAYVRANFADDADPYGVYPGHDDHMVEFAEKKLPERKGRLLIKPRSAITDILETETETRPPKAGDQLILREVRPVTNTINESA